MNRRDEYPVISVAGRSVHGGDPDIAANRLLQGYGFVPKNGYGEVQLHQDAVPAEARRDSYRLRVEGFAPRLVASVIYVEGHKELCLDNGRLLKEEKPHEKSRTIVFTIEGRHLAEWTVHCRFTSENVVSPQLNTSDVLLRSQLSTKSPTAPKVPHPVTIPRASAPVSALILPPSKTQRPQPQPQPQPPQSEPAAPSGDLPVILKIPVHRIRRFADQPRKYFRKDALRKLGESLLQEGQQIPIEVIRVEGDENAGFELVDGERRWRAAKLVGIPSLDAIVKPKREIADARTQHRKSLTVNFCREGHSKLEVALALLKEREAGTSPDALARICGRSLPWVYAHLAITRLVPELLVLLDPDLPREKQLAFQLAYELAKAPHARQMGTYEEVMKIGGHKLQLLKAKSLVSEFGPQNRFGRKRKPSDDREKLESLVVSITADALAAQAMPPAAFESLARHHALAIGGMCKRIEEAVKALDELKDKIRIGQERVGAK